MKPFRKPSNILVTGGSGFIGSNFIRFILSRPDFAGRLVNLDKLSYAAHPASLDDVEAAHGGRRYFFEHGDIVDTGRVLGILKQYAIDTLVHFAAESHVDRSLHGPAEFINTNIVGTFSLLETARQAWAITPAAASGTPAGLRQDVLFHHVSTDEVYGSLGPQGWFYETTAYDPRSPYSASKAGSDHLVKAYHHSYGLPATVSNCSNNYGPYQFPEKLVPLMILNMLEDKPLPVYGDGLNVRDWLYVEDHAAAIWAVVRAGRDGETYNVGGGCEWENIRLVRSLCELTARLCGVPAERYTRLISFVKDRPGHDRRYAINCDKIRNELGWRPAVDFEAGLERTVRWYLEHPDWVKSVRSGEYRNWVERNYSAR
jgi:dTDP-glucose 4,6-dehydratase